MCRRSVAGGAGRNNDFARQLAERNNPDQPNKKFRTSAPKGSRFAQGYVDRAKERQAAEEEQEDDKAARIKALEESLKKEEIDQATFEKLRNEIAGGDLSSTHLIKGLDFKLLERIKRGEDVFGEQPAPSAVAADEADDAPEQDVDDAFEQLEDKKFEAVVKEKAKKKGQLATTTLVPGQKRSRDQILAEMKAAREAAKANQLGNRFKKIGAKKEPGSRIERDAKGREVLIIVDEDGNERRKVRKVAAEVEKEREAFKVAPDAKVLGMEVPEYYQKKLEAQQQEDEDVKMFSDVESDYDPLQGLGSDTDGDESGDEAKERARSKSPASGSPKSDVDEGEIVSDSLPPATGAMAPPPKPPQPVQHPRNYFKSSLISEQEVSGPALNDPSVLAALKKAKTLNAQTKSEEEQKEAEREARLKKMLASADRDDADLDMGFGTSRMQDEEEMEDDGKTKLSAWGGDDDDEEGGGGGGGGKAKRKRGGKKRKGDGNNIADVMRVLDQRKGAEK